MSNIYKDVFPEECGLNLDNLKEYSGNGYRRYEYFGDCRNTVNIDKMWNGTQMSNWIYSNCQLLVDKDLPLKIFGGDRSIPKRLERLLNKYDILDFEHL